ncbi:MAG: hypothetical protein DRJ31_07865 [Candidatus Methanomethylicota archaeon]|uniref:Uncharacterized protein n=1 Tax=Thermoproteota archaeon TaxID=2056631 RepID=A0A497ENK8_9CREN|nr:MAG: hypothetical protein DRJ31_07865 [Candidatus Verstraetearchaeota archaeon]
MKLYELTCPFIKECRYANNKCYGFRVVECPHFEEHEKKVKEFMKKLFEFARKYIVPKKVELEPGKCADLNGLRICKESDGSWKVFVEGEVKIRFVGKLNE